MEWNASSFLGGAPLEGDGIVVRELQSIHEAAKVSSFLLSESAFDDQRFTPGEVKDFRERPRQSLEMDSYSFLVAWDPRDEVAGIVSFYENEQRTGGYTMEYLAVHRISRKAGIGSRLVDAMFDMLTQRGGRYVVTNTCDLAEYRTVLRFFEVKGFRQVGYYPDYYYEGEARMSYYRKL